jgi:hypothetical protein
MAKSIYEIFESKAIAAYWKDVNANMQDPMIGTKYFPVSKQTGLSLAWIKGKNNLPVALQPAAFDTKASLRDRIGVSELSTEMPFFREAMRIGEKDRQDIETLLSKGEKFAEPTILRIFDDTKNLVDGALVQAERMRMALLWGGSISISATAENGRPIAYNYDYDADGTWATENNVELTGTSTWTLANKATSNPINDLMDAAEVLSTKFGVKAVEVIMNTVTFKGLIASDSIKKAMNPNGASSLILTRLAAKQFVQDETQLIITIYDKMFKDEQGNDKKFYPDGYCTLVPSYALGNTWFGTTPEEFDLLSGTVTDASTSIVNTGVAITTVKQPHPVNVETIVDAIVLPSFERMTDIYVIKVF